MGSKQEHGRPLWAAAVWASQDLWGTDRMTHSELSSPSLSPPGHKGAGKSVIGSGCSQSISFLTFPARL